MWAIIVFLFSCWDEDIRPRIAKVRGIQPNDIKMDVFGDIRILRKCIIHERGHLPTKEFVKLKVLSNLVDSDKAVSLTHDQMHSLFVAVKNAIGEIILEKTGHLPGAPKPGEIKDIAIQRRNPKK